VRITSRSGTHVLNGRVYFYFALFLLAVALLTVAETVRHAAVAPAGKPAAAGDPADEPHYTGSIVIPTPGGTVCRHLLFDNVTGQIREVDAGECRAAGSDINSTEGRIGAIRRSFAK
jgi:hypothetical protein